MSEPPEVGLTWAKIIESLPEPEPAPFRLLLMIRWFRRRPPVVVIYDAVPKPAPGQIDAELVEQVSAQLRPWMADIERAERWPDGPA